MLWIISSMGTEERNVQNSIDDVKIALDLKIFIYFISATLEQKFACEKT